MNSSNENIYEAAMFAEAKREADSIVMPYDKAKLTDEQYEKIVNHANRIGVAYSELLHEVLTNKMVFLTVVSKSPSRMNFYEKTFKDYVEANYVKNPNYNIKSIVSLPAGGEGAKYVIDGKVESLSDYKTEAEKEEFIKRKIAAGLKSLDFEITVETPNGLKKGYITAKYTKIDGGSQDNQFKDVQRTLQQSTEDMDFLLIANIDGEYYVKPRNSGSHFDSLTERYSHNLNVVVSTYKNIGDLLNTL